MSHYHHRSAATSQLGSGVLDWTSHGSIETSDLHARRPFKGFGANVTQVAMTPIAVIEDLDVVEDVDPQSPERKYSSIGFVSAEKRRITDTPNKAHVSTSYVERQNLTMRMSMRQFTRLTNRFSKKLENHAHTVALHFMFYNFGCIHKTLRVTPAMQASVADHVWTLEEIARLAPDPLAKKRGPYRKRQDQDSKSHCQLTPSTEAGLSVVIKATLAQQVAKLDLGGIPSCRS